MRSAFHVTKQLSQSGGVKMPPPEEKESTKIKKKCNCLEPVRDNVSDFMDATTIHGFKYLIGNDRTIFEKILWCAVLVASFYTCSLMVKSTWQKWQENPTFIGFGQTPVLLWQIPFPAVTICPGYLLNKESNYTFSFTVDNDNWRVGNASTVCDAYDGTNEDEFLTEFDTMDFSEGQKWEEFLLETTVLRSQFIKNLLFGSKPTSMSPFLSKSVCYSFNMLDRSSILRDVAHLGSDFGNQNSTSCWSFDEGYCKRNESVYPRRARATEVKLEMNLNSELNKVACMGTNEYYIHLHHPGEFPDANNRILIEIKKKNEIIIKPEITITSESLRNLPPSRKKCVFSTERYLQFYKIYTQGNCKLECLANYTLRNCGCVPHELPHTKTAKLCGKFNSTTVECMSEAEGMMDELESGLSKNYLNLPLCKCLPSCNSRNYDAKVKLSNSRKNKTYVTLQFKETEFSVMERKELFGDVDFWASCGGILGLFTGFSTISLAEIAYFLLFRWLFAWIRRLWKIMRPNMLT